MRKLETKSSEAKKTKRNQLIVGIILIFVMLGSTFGIIMNSFGDNEKIQDKLNYNGYNFYLQNNLWILKEGEYTFSFSYNPVEVENLSNLVIGNLSYINSYNSLPLYISSKDYYSNAEIYNVMSQFVERIQNACYENETCNSDVPIKDCTNNFIILRESETNSIYQKDKCVFINGKKEDLVKLTDVYLYKILGI